MRPECARYRERFSEYLDRELPRPERDRLEAHLDRCAECRGELNALHRTVEAVGGLPMERAPAGFARSVMAELPAEEPAAQSRSVVRILWARALPVAAMFLVVVGAALLVARNGLFGEGGRAPELAMQQREAPAAAPRARAGGRAMKDAAAADSLRKAPAREEMAEEGAPQDEAASVRAPRPGARLLEEQRAEKMVELEREAAPAAMRVGQAQAATPMLAGHGMAPALPREPRQAKEANVPAQLNVWTRDTAALMQRVVTVAQRRNVGGNVSFAPDGSFDVVLNVPGELYADLLNELSALPGADRLALEDGQDPATQVAAQVLANRARAARPEQVIVRTEVLRRAATPEEADAAAPRALSAGEEAPHLAEPQMAPPGLVQQRVSIRPLGQLPDAE